MKNRWLVLAVFCFQYLLTTTQIFHWFPPNNFPCLLPVNRGPVIYVNKDKYAKNAAYMKRYLNLQGDSGVVAFEMGRDYIKILFRGGEVYLYTNAITGWKHVAEMKKLAVEGRGLSTEHLYQPACEKPLRGKTMRIPACN